MGSGSRDQWERIQKQNHSNSTDPNAPIVADSRSQSRPPLSSSSPLRSKEELDFILKNNCSTKYYDDDDESDYEREPSEASTAVTGNVSRFSHQKENNNGRVVTPDTSPRSRHSGKGRERGRDRHRDGRRREDDVDDSESDSSDDDDDDSSYRGKSDNRRRSHSRKLDKYRHDRDRHTRREKSRSKSRSKSKSRSSQSKLFMCGAMDVTEEMRGSMKDANASIRQIISTVRKFGPEEKDAVRDTVRDAREVLRRTLRSAVSCRGK